jgi:hypothetical protein
MGTMIFEKLLVDWQKSVHQISFRSSQVRWSFINMKALPTNEEFLSLAARMIWFEPPEVALRDVTRFLAFAFRYATHEDMKALRGVLSDDDLLEALAQAPPGIIDPRSWSYWHVVLGMFFTPALTRREFGVGGSMGRQLNALSP